MPHARSQEPPRGNVVYNYNNGVPYFYPIAHSDDIQPFFKPFWYRFFSVTMLLVLVVGVLAVVGGVAWKKKQERNRKRFF